MCNNYHLLYTNSCARKESLGTTAETEKNQVYVPRLSDSKLKELSWSLDINENLNPLTGEDGRNTK